MKLRSNSVIKNWVFILFFLNLILFFIFLITQHFPFYAVFANIVSIFAITIWSLNFHRIYNYIKKNPLDLVLFLILFFTAFFIYQYKLDIVTPGIQSDEISIIEASEKVSELSEFIPFININYGHPTPLLYLTSVAIDLFGREPFAGRLQGIIFGAASVAVFFVLLRIFFSRSISFATSLLMMFAYPLIVLSRLAYEITPSLFFQIVTVIFLYLSLKSRDVRYFSAVGIFLGMGLFTYVGFRTFAVLILLLAGYFIFIKTKDHKKSSKEALFVIAPLFIVASTLVAYSVGHFGEIMERSRVLSIFGQSLTVVEIVKELGGNIARLSYIFFFEGDPNLKQNPVGRSIFDIGTFLLFVTGLFYLFKVKKWVLLLLLIFFIPPLINDFLSLERIPEFHYYGIGHPSTLRIAGIIPPVFFAVAVALNGLKKQFAKINEGMDMILVPLILIVIIFYNWVSYFNQPFNIYDYKFNGAIAMNIVREMNLSNAKKICVSPLYLEDYRLRYFANKDKEITEFSPKSDEEIINQINKSDMCFVASGTSNKSTVESLQNYILSNPNSNFSMYELKNHWGYIDGLVITK